MNSQLLQEIYSAKIERRKQLSQLPVDDKVVIIERLRDMAATLKAARKTLIDARFGMPAGEK